jgi:FAD synthetase
MSLKELVSKYITSAEHVLKELQTVKGSLSVERRDIMRVVDCAKAYLDDAKYYRDEERFEVGLTSVAYCEGLLDALKLLGAVKFEWPTRMKRRER